MRKKVFQLLVDNTSGVLSRISGLFPGAAIILKALPQV